MIKAVLLDDETHCNESLKRQLEKLRPGIHIEGVFDSATRFIEKAVSLDFNLLFLDINMPGKGGFEVLDHLAGQDFKLIIVSAFDSYAIRAFRYSAIDYLLKPVDPEELELALQKSENQKINNTSPLQIGQLKQLFEEKKSPEKLIISSSKSIDIIPFEDIMRCEALGNYASVYLQTGEKHVCSYPLKELEKLLDPNQFIRTHQSHLVNKTFVKRVLRKEGGFAELTDGTEIPIARQRKEQVLELLLG